VAVDGDTAVIASLGDDDFGGNTGAVYVFVRSGTTWGLQAKLYASNPQPQGYFGETLAIERDTMLVGASYGSVTGYRGTVYVFTRSGTTWTEQTELLPSETGYVRFGSAVDLYGDTALIGAMGSESAYVFVGSGASWSEQALLKPGDPSTEDEFGITVGLHENTAVVGAPENDVLGPESGSAYIFKRNGTTWVQASQLLAPDGASGDLFGGAVAAEHNTVLIGAKDDLYYKGSAYIFVRDAGTWVMQDKISASDAYSWERFGGAVALDEDTAVVGAVAGDDYTGSSMIHNTGAAYVYEVPPPGRGFCFGDQGEGTPCPCNNDNDSSLRGAGCANGIFPSGAKLVGDGAPSVSVDTLVLSAVHLEPNQAGLYFQGTTDNSPGYVWGDGLRCAGGQVIRLQVRLANANGGSATTVDLGAAGNVQAGQTLFYQIWYRNPTNPPCGAGLNDFNASNGFVVTWVM